MVGFLKPTAELAESDYDEDGNEIPSTKPPEPKSRFEMNIWQDRGWLYWAYREGLTEAEIMEMQMKCVGLLEDAGQHLSSSSISSQPVSSGLRAVLPTKMRHVPIAFSASAAKKCTAFGSVAVLVQQ